MTQDRFIQILEAYGANPSRWPEAERADAEAFADKHSELFQKMIRAEAALDAALDQTQYEPGELLENRILSTLPKPAKAWNWRALSAVAAALVLAFAFFMSSEPITTMDETEALYADAFSGFDEDWVDWFESDA